MSKRLLPENGANNFGGAKIEALSEFGSELSWELEDMPAENELVRRKGFEGLGFEVECKKDVCDAPDDGWAITLVPMALLTSLLLSFSDISCEESTTLITGVDEVTNKGLEVDFMTDSLRTTKESLSVDTLALSSLCSALASVKLASMVSFDASA